MVWVTVVVGLVSLVAGNLLTRSTEYRKWRRIERHKACALLLDASHATMLIAAWQKAVPEALNSQLQTVTQDYRAAMESLAKGRVTRFLLKPIAKRLVTRMNPGVSPDEIDDTLSGVISSIATQSEGSAVDFVGERMGVGKGGRLTHLRESASKLGTALESVELICPNKVVQAGRNLHRATLSLAEASHDDANPEKAILEYRVAREIFVFEARHDLSGSPFRRRQSTLRRLTRIGSTSDGQPEE